jgi:hypothetical protein
LFDIIDGIVSNRRRLISVADSRLAASTMIDVYISSRNKYGCLMFRFCYYYDSYDDDGDSDGDS